jgi:hypothetical protein
MAKKREAMLTTGDLEYLKDCGELITSIGKIKYVGRLRKHKKFKCNKK